MSYVGSMSRGRGNRNCSNGSISVAIGLFHSKSSSQGHSSNFLLQHQSGPDFNRVILHILEVSSLPLFHHVSDEHAPEHACCQGHVHVQTQVLGSQPRSREPDMTPCENVDIRDHGAVVGTKGEPEMCCP